MNIDSEFEDNSDNFFETENIIPHLNGFTLKPSKIKPPPDVNLIKWYSCRILVSITDKNAYFVPKCEKHKECFDFCHISQTIIGLDSNTSYDIMILTNKKYGNYILKNHTTSIKIKI